MRILVDTQVLLWIAEGSPRLSPQVSNRLRDRENEVLFSAASIWEIAIKMAAKRSGFAVDAHETARLAVESGFAELPIDWRAAARAAELPLHHRDPFDRIIIAQAMTEPARLLTADEKLLPYSDLVTLI